MRKPEDRIAHAFRIIFLALIIAALFGLALTISAATAEGGTHYSTRVLTYTNPDGTKRVCTVRTGGYHSRYGSSSATDIECRTKSRPIKLDYDIPIGETSTQAWHLAYHYIKKSNKGKTNIKGKAGTMFIHDGVITLGEHEVRVNGTTEAAIWEIIQLAEGAN